MFAYCVSAAYQEAIFRGASQTPRCASRRAPKGAVEERIHRLDDGLPFVWSPTAGTRASSSHRAIELIAAKTIAGRRIDQRGFRLAERCRPGWRIARWFRVISP